MSGKLTKFSLVLLGCGLSGAGQAQWTWSTAPLNAINMDVQRQGIMAQVRRQSQAEVRRSFSANQLDATAPAPNELTLSFAYQVSPTRRTANLARFVRLSRAVDPQGAAAMEKLFASTDVFAAMDQSLAPVGLRTDDVADAYSIWWMSAWGAAHGDSSSPSRAKARAVRAQAARALAATPEFTAADSTAKQEFAEALLIQTVLIDGMMEQYGRDPAMARKVAASVRQGASASGLDLDAMTLTQAGFVPAR